MKKTIYIMLSIILVVIIGIAIYLCTKKDKVLENTDAIKFKEEYEAINGTTNSVGKEYLNLEIKENNIIEYASYEKLDEVLKGTGVIYLGYSECPWCRNVVPVLLTVSKKVSLNKIYYMNIYNERDKKILDEQGNIVVENEGTEGYKKLVETLKDVLPVYDGLNDSELKRIYVSLVIFVKDGKIIGTHTSTVDSQTDPYVALTDEQSSELKQIYTDYLLEVMDGSCDDEC